LTAKSWLTSTMNDGLRWRRPGHVGLDELRPEARRVGERARRDVVRMRVHRIRGEHQARLELAQHLGELAARRNAVEERAVRLGQGAPLEDTQGARRLRRFPQPGLARAHRRRLSVGKIDERHP